MGFVFGVERGFQRIRVKDQLKDGKWGEVQREKEGWLAGWLSVLHHCFNGDRQEGIGRLGLRVGGGTNDGKADNECISFMTNNRNQRLKGD